MLTYALYLSFSGSNRQQRSRASNVILFEIDEKAVSDAVSFEPLVHKTAPAPSPLPPPPKPDLAVSLPSLPSISLPKESSPTSSFEGLPADLPIVAIAGGFLATFAVGTFLMRGRGEEDLSSASVPESTPFFATSPSDDISIPYDSAARIAYDEWRASNNKGAFDGAKFQNFKVTYNAITSDNMASKKKAREAGSTPTLKSLSANADQ